MKREGSIPRMIGKADFHRRLGNDRNHLDRLRCRQSVELRRKVSSIHIRRFDQSMRDGGAALHGRVDRQASRMDRDAVELRLSRPREATDLISALTLPMAQFGPNATPQGSSPT